MSNYWNFHDKKMLELKSLYTKISRQTKNHLQEIFDSFKIDSNNIYSVADFNSKKRINTYIDEWRDKKLLSGYFGMLCNDIYKRKQVKNNDILNLLIYAAYIEEQKKLDDLELLILKEDANHYYQEGQKEVKKQNKVSEIPDAIFLALINKPDSKGYIWIDYKEATIKYNAEQITRQALINIQQEKELKIDSGEFDNIIKKQQNTKLCVNKDNGKISGNIDNLMIGINNQAKIEGITKCDEDAKVIFVAIEDEKTTEMCKSLDGQEFSVKGENEFERYSALHESRIKYKCKGLVLGLNLPPINDHFHYCRSTIIYLNHRVNRDNIVKELDIPKRLKIQNDIRNYIITNNIVYNKEIEALFEKYLTDTNVVLDTKNEKIMYYDKDIDKIIINPSKKDFSKYNLLESLNHEIIHLIEQRNKISLDIENDIMKAQSEIMLYSDKYIAMFKDDRYASNMTLSDIFSSLTYDNIAGKFGHDYDYWYDIDNIVSELSANIMTAYINNNQDTLNIIDQIGSLKRMKERVINKYEKHIR